VPSVLAAFMVPVSCLPSLCHTMHHSIVHYKRFVPATFLAVPRFAVPFSVVLLQTLSFTVKQGNTVFFLVRGEETTKG
jgi:hypothetical protein